MTSREESRRGWRRSRERYSDRDGSIRRLRDSSPGTNHRKLRNRGTASTSPRARRRPSVDTNDRRYRRRHNVAREAASKSPSVRHRRRRRDRSHSNDHFSSCSDDRRKRRRQHRSASRRRRRRGSPSPPARSRRHYHSDEEEEERHRSRRRRHRHRSPASSSPEHRRRWIRRSQRMHHRRSSHSTSERRHPLQVVAGVAPRAGIVSDDDDGGTGAVQVPNNRKLQPPQVPPAIATNRSQSSIYDDTVGHYKGTKGSVIANEFRIVKEVGVGTFGRVLECVDFKRVTSNRRRDHDNHLVAIKVVRNVRRYYESALIEADIIEDVNKRGGRGVSHCAVMYDAFSFKGHYCMVFESLGPSLYDFLKRQNYQPFPLTCVRDFARQLLETLEFLHSFRLIHTDLKPENILLLNDREVGYKGHTIPESTRIKVIDFGGATYDKEKKSSVVNTRQYRAPEVILGVGWSMPSDMWSIGCILVELYQGELLFATHGDIEHLALIEKVIGPFPKRMLKRAKNKDLANQAFDSIGAHRMERVLAPDSLEYVKRVGPLKTIVYEEDVWFLRLLRNLLVTDPDERATARECLRKF